MAIQVNVSKDASCVSGYVRVNGSNRRVFQIYHSRSGMPDLEFATAYAEALKKIMEEAPYEPK